MQKLIQIRCKYFRNSNFSRFVQLSKTCKEYFCISSLLEKFSSLRTFATVHFIRRKNLFIANAFNILPKHYLKIVEFLDIS